MGRIGPPSALELQGGTAVPSRRGQDRSRRSLTHPLWTKALTAGDRDLGRKYRLRSASFVMVAGALRRPGIPLRTARETRPGEAQSSSASAASSSTWPHLQQNAFVESRVSRHQMVVALQFEQWWILSTIGVIGPFPSYSCFLCS